MAHKKVASFVNGTTGRTTVVGYSSEFDEYRVKFTEAGKYQEGADYFTDCRQDALDTAQAWTNKPVDPLAGCASMSNPPKTYGSLSTGLEVAAYRNSRLDHWNKALGNKGYTPEVFEQVEADVIAKFGKPF